MSLFEPSEPDDDLGRLLTASAPRTYEPTPAIEDELVRMSVAARTDVRPSVRPRRTASRVAVLGFAAALVVGGAGAAAAATSNWWTSWWAGSPDGIYHYTLPSGAECEGRLGNITVTTGPPEVADVLKDYMAHHDLVQEDDIEAEISRMRADTDRWQVGGDGGLEPAGYGTKYYPGPDTEYQRALEYTIWMQFDEALRQHGYDTEQPTYNFFEQEINCPGAKW